MTSEQRIEQIEKRLRTVERSARRWRAVATLAVVVAVGIGTLGAAMNKAARVVDVEGINFVDKEGVNRGFIGVSDEGYVELKFRGKDNEASVALLLQDHGPSLALSAPEGHGAIALKAGSDGGAMAIFDESDRARMSVSIIDDDVLFNLRNSKDKGGISMMAANTVGGMITVKDTEGNPLEK